MVDLGTTALAHIPNGHPTKFDVWTCLDWGMTHNDRELKGGFVKRRGLIAVLTAVVFASGVGLAPAASASPGGKVQGEQNRASAVADYQRVEPLLDVPVGWTGTAKGCKAGTTSQANRRATLEMVNYVRSLGGLPKVKLDKNYSEKAQKAALIMRANNYLTHYPTRSASCFSKAGYRGASKSNLSMSWGYDDELSASTGPRSVMRYMLDEGDNNLAVGHRRWVMYQRLSKIGTGDTDNTNAMYVVGDFAAKSTAKWVAWPTAGYFPREMEPDGRWSLSYPNADFSRAKVTVTTPDGKQKTRVVDRGRGAGDNSIVWEWALPKSFQANPTAELPVTVKASDIRVGGQNVTKEWQTTLIRASAKPAPAPEPELEAWTY